MEPFYGMSMLPRLFDRWFEDFGRELGFTPAVDVDETPTHYIVSCDLPGMHKADINIEVRDSQLVVSGERKEEREEGEKRSHYRAERYYGNFLRVFPLPSGVDSNLIEANYENGVLQIALPKVESATKPRQIKIDEEKGGFFKRLLKKEPKKTEKVA